jgi:CRISPR-associated protein Cas1
LNALYLSGFGVSLNVDSARLIVKDGFLEPDADQVVHELQPRDARYDSIVIDGQTGTVSLTAIKWLMRHGIPIFILDYDGTILSSILPREPISSRLKIAQVKAYEDDETRLQIAKKLIEAKIQHTKDVLDWLSQRYDVQNSLRQIEAERSRLEKARSLASLTMVEGRVADAYWKAFAWTIPSSYGFRSRMHESHQMNASDPVNCLLNYSYAFLESVCRKHLNVVGLDPTIGFLHEINPSKYPLVYDLMEPFRWITDTTVIDCLESQEFKRSDFFRTDNYVLRMKPSAVRRLLNRLRGRFNSTTKYLGKSYRWDTVILLKAQDLARHILDGEPLNFSIPSPELERTDSSELRNRILTLSQSEARRLEISRSTLHYLRKNARSNAPFKIYRKVCERLESSDASPPSDTK